MTTWKVEVSKMNGSDNRFKNFSNYKDALSYYAEQVDYHNIDGDDANWPAADTEVELSAGGRGYDYRIELLEDKDEE